jgi:pSer/pThr/pTyr-binding forkhead associated (FHA) protein
MKAKLIIDFDKEVTISEGVTTIGRASDNIISFVNDSNVSRFHAEIETRGDEFWFVELGSSNGSKINGEIISGEKLLQDGDVILLGGTSEIEFFVDESRVESEESEVLSPKSQVSSPKVEKPNSATPNSENSENSKLPIVLAVAAIACGLAIVSIFAVIFYLNMETSCKAEAKIVGIQNGLTLTEPTQVNLEYKGESCIKQAVYMLDGEPIASETSPFSTTIDPNNFANLVDGGTHVLTVALVDNKGIQTTQSSNILLVFETPEITKKATPIVTPSIEPTDNPNPNPNPNPTIIDNRQISAADVVKMCNEINKQFSGKFAYKFDNQFIQAVQAKTSEFKSEGYFSRASQYQDTINVAFAKDNQIDASLGYFLAMSRSQFKNEKHGNNEGLWQMTSDFVSANGYSGVCENQTLSDKDQTCAAKVASLYLKNLLVKVFDGDTIYSVSAFGMSEQEAIDFKSKLPADRTNIWQVLRNPKQRDEVVRFFAAAIVAENPLKFGLKRDSEIHKLYDFTMTK